MKQLKQPHGHAHERHADATAPAQAPDSRPTKVPAEYRGRRLHPAPGATALPAKPKAHADGTVHPGAVATDGRRAKEPATAAGTGPAAERDAARTPDGGRPDQRPAGASSDTASGASSGAAQPAEQYVRLRVRLRDGELTLLDSHLVDGPLAQPDALHGAAAYEVLAGERLLHAAAVPDLGLESRSFPDPDGAPEQRGHHLTPRAASVFSVRVPAAELTAETLGSVRVRLHRVLEPVHGLRAGLRSLGEHAPDGVAPLAELAGLPESVLPQAIEARGGRTGRGA